jgi:hypothetical protein
MTFASARKFRDYARLLWLGRRIPREDLIAVRIDQEYYVPGGNIGFEVESVRRNTSGRYRQLVIVAAAPIAVQSKRSGNRAVRKQWRVAAGAAE